jgi:alpha-beta hydrolase superfamily lysophospholipase
MRFFAYAWRAAIAYLALAAIVPTSVNSLRSHPSPTRDYATAMRLAADFRRGDSLATPDGRSILLVHGARAPRTIVLFHGFTNSPHEFQQLATGFYEAGDNVFVPRLSMQGLTGGDADTLSGVRAEALRDIADQSIDIATGLGDTVVVLGFSLGGDVAAWAAQFRPEVDRAVIVAPALGLSHVMSPLQAPLMNLALRVPNYSSHEAPDSLRPDRSLGWSTRGVAEMLHLGEAVLRFAKTRAPASHALYMLANAADHTVSRDAIYELSRRWTATGGRVTTYEFPDSLGLPHDTVDPEQLGANVATTYPVFTALVYGQPVPAVAARRAGP